MKKLTFLLISSMMFVTVGCTNPSTPPGYEGYVRENPRIFGKGGFRGELKGPANYGVSLWRNVVTNVDFRPRTYGEDFNINSTLTQNYLQHEAINAQLKMAASPNHTTVYIPSGSNGIPLVKTLK